VTWSDVEMARRAAVMIMSRDYKVGDVVKVKAIIIHPMDTGFIKDKRTGRVKPRFFIKRVTAYYNDKIIAHFDLEVAASQNPKIIFPVKITAPGMIKVIFENNKGEKTVKSTEVSPVEY